MLSQLRALAITAFGLSRRKIPPVDVEGQLSDKIPGFYPEEMAKNLLNNNGAFSGDRVLYQQSYTLKKESLLAEALTRLGVVKFLITPHVEKNEPVMRVSIK